ncbi:MAG TPA: hypothetical protein VGP24_15300, partial [Glaciihabitans sp.]|nr:hypothetical protein [Glaciihabitans sp.]
RVFMYLDSDTSSQNVYQMLYLQSGTVNDGIFSGTFTIPFAATPGTWTARFGFLEDNVGNNTASTAFTTINPPQITVTSSAPDSAPPVLREISLSPQAIDVSAQAQTVTATAHITDDNSGVGRVFMYLDSDTSSQNVYQMLYLQSGTVNDGIFSGTFTIPFAATAGTWTARFGFLEDNVGNNTASTAFTTSNPPQITVTSSRSSDPVVTPESVAFVNSAGTAEDTYTIPSVKGVRYRLDGKDVPAGTYTGTGSITVTAVAETGYTFTPDAVTEWQFTFTSDDSRPDLSVPPSLVSFKRTSPDVVRHGDTISFDWQVKNVPVTHVMFYLRDRLGNLVYVRWDGEKAFNGTASLTVDETKIASGDLTLWDVGLGTGTTGLSYIDDGTISKSPSGLQDPEPAILDFKAAGLHLSPTTPYQATPAPVVFTDQDGTAEDTYTIPPTDGVDYQIGGKTVEAGTHAAAGTVTVTAKAKTDYVLTGTTEWAATFKATPYQVTPAPVVFTDRDGTAQDTYTIPITDGVDYQVSGKTIAAGTYPATETVTVTAKAKTDYVLTGTTEWATTFKATPYQATPAPVVFTDRDGTAQDSYTIP